MGILSCEGFRGFGISPTSILPQSQRDRERERERARVRESEQRVRVSEQRVRVSEQRVRVRVRDRKPEALDEMKSGRPNAGMEGR